MPRLSRSLYLFAAALVLAAPLPAARGAPAGPALQAVIAGRSAEDRARDAARHPVETLTFFQVRPGMSVAEVLPGSGWYTRILAAYLGPQGTLYGVNYNDRMWPLFPWATDAAVAERIAATGAFADNVAGYTDNGIHAEGFTFATLPDESLGTVDRVLIIRALHNLNRFEAQAGTRSQALAAVRAMLRPGGLVGVVQHRLPESAPAGGSDGSRGYLKQSDVIAMFAAAGFELVASSEINANPADRPGPDEVVWRLPPSLNDSAGDPARRAAMEAIGESDRMTLLFRRLP